MQAEAQKALIPLDLWTEKGDICDPLSPPQGAYYEVSVHDTHALHGREHEPGQEMSACFIVEIDKHTWSTDG